MRGRRAGAAASLLAAAALAAATPGAVGAQQGGQERSCRLVLEPTTDSTESVSVEVEPDTYVTYVRGGLRWTCGASRMVADSAVRYERDGRLEMIGSADYRDSIRTLLAEKVTYFEREDRILAEGDVRLTRRATGSTLEGPRVEFFRVAPGEVRRTVATGRPTMRIRRDTAAADTAPPLRVVGDRIVLLGDREVRVRGDVVIRRPDTEARSDSAVFHLDEDTGEMHGSPEVTGEAWRLTGRTIRTRFEEGELREVVAEEEGHASGDDFELFAPRIRARLANREIDRLWAHGDDRPVALSPPYRLAGDSLAFGFDAGEIEQVRAVGNAEAVETGQEPPDDPRSSIALTAGERSWVAADTITLAFAPPAGASDSIEGGAGGPGLGGTPGDTARPSRAAPRDSGAPSLLVPADSLRDVTGVPEDSAGAPRRDGAPAGTAGEDGRRIETMHAVGSARAYHLLEPEEPGGRPAKHYQRGREIVVHFEEGEAVRLEGKDAVGVHADPTDDAPAGEGAGDVGPPPAPPADSAPPDSIPPSPPDTAAAPPPYASRGPRARGEVRR